MIRLFSDKDLMAVENAMQQAEPLEMVRHSRISGVSARIVVSDKPPEIWDAYTIASLHVDAGHIESIQHFDNFHDLQKRIKEENL